MGQRDRPPQLQLLSRSVEEKHVEQNQLVGKRRTLVIVPTNRKSIPLPNTAARRVLLRRFTLAV
jgi:hypothetical protein